MAAHPGGGPGTHSQRSAVRLQQHLSHWLLLYAMSAIAAGLAMGYPWRDWTGSHTGGIGTLTTAAVFLVIYPMMVNLRSRLWPDPGATCGVCCWPWPTTSSGRR